MTASSLGGLHLRCLAALVLFLCGTPFGGPSSAHADVTVATVSNPTPVSFFAGRLSWSAFDSARNGYVLMTHAAGSTSVVPARERSVPFDADLGPDEHGDTVAVYSRCGREPVGTVWRSGRGCDIFKFSFGTGRETRVASANGARSSEFLPSIWDTRIGSRASTSGEREGPGTWRTCTPARCSARGARSAYDRAPGDASFPRRTAGRSAVWESRTVRPRSTCAGGGSPSPGARAGVLPGRDHERLARHHR